MMTTVVKGTCSAPNMSHVGRGVRDANEVYMRRALYCTRERALATAINGSEREPAFALQFGVYIYARIRLYVCALYGSRRMCSYV